MTTIKNKKCIDHDEAILEINLNNLSKNYSQIKNTVSKNTEVAASVKANGYGLGVSYVVNSLIKKKCKTFFVATLNEGLELRKLNKTITIMILNGLNKSRISEYRKKKLVPVINDLDQLKASEKYSKERKKIKIAIHFDTGMSRLGLDLIQTNELLKKKDQLIKYSELKLIMSHLACGDEPKNQKNIKQLNDFKKIAKFFPDTKKSLSNSAGIQLGRKYDFDMVRPGISLYGGHSRANEGEKYKNVVSLKAKIIQIRKIKAHETVGYGATFKANKPMVIGTIPIGYADGFFRKFSDGTSFFVGETKVRMIGRVSMDLVTLDLSSLKDQMINQTNFVEIINEKNNINKLSKIVSTIPYEILTSLGNRYQRRYIG